MLCLAHVSNKILFLHEKSYCHVHFKYKQACCRDTTACMFICEHSVPQSVRPYLTLLIRCLLTEQLLLGIDLLRRTTQPYQRPVMIISIKPVGLLNTDNVRRIDGLRRTGVRRRWQKGKWRRRKKGNK